MKTKKLFYLIIFSLWVFVSFGQDAMEYQLPPREISDLLLAKPTPTVRVDSKLNYLILLGRNSYPMVEELGQPEIKVAGLRINPLNFSPTRQTFVNSISISNCKTGKSLEISGLPKNLSASNFLWNQAENKIAFTQNEKKSVDLYVIDLLLKKATKINIQPLNMVLGNSFAWLDDQTLVYKSTIQSPDLIPVRPITPKGPTVQQTLGKSAPRPTYQDLIKSEFDEKLFDFFAQSQLMIYANGQNKKIGLPNRLSSFSISPDQKYLLTREIEKPFSYSVPAYGFNTSIRVIQLDGKEVSQLAKIPSSENAPSGNDNVLNAPRGFEWRDDEPSTVIYTMPLDSGLIKKQVEYHDVVLALKAPFNEKPAELFKTKMRFSDVSWGDQNFAMVTEVSRAKQNTRVSAYNPLTGQINVLYERNLTDAYGNPGSPIRKKNSFGKHVIQTFDDGKTLLMNNPVGSSEKGDLPFLAKFNLETKKNEIIWRAKEGSFEFIDEVIDEKTLTVLSRKESQTEVPNYYIKSLLADTKEQKITNFSDPYPSLQGVKKEKIKYKRSDGVDLTGDLYLPKGYDKSKNGPLPVLIWAYPREFNSANDAAQVRGSKDRFTSLSWASPIFYVTQGYAVLDNAEMPIVSTDATHKPNDNFIEQLKMNASAAIDYLVKDGIGDAKRMAVGGHSYGAFMTANLLAHTDLFKAGIARSGAYNRTLTPFGFQNEDRTYWQAPSLYYEMSPFSYANKLKEPILLIHGEADDNTGTYPINSERLYAAIKGNGGISRFVYLPYEAHSYRGKENLLHMLWEQFQWLEKYVK